MQTIPWDSAQHELSTIGDFIRWGMSALQAADVYYGHGTDNAWDEALALVLASIHVPLDFDRSEILSARLLTEEKALIISRLKQRIEQRMPLPYITNQSVFCGLNFYVDARVLIPRSPIAELIEQQFLPWIHDPDSVEDILDLCCGGGCIGIASAMAFPHADVVLADIDPEALAVAEHNVHRYDLAEQVSLVQSDLFENLPVKCYDIIVSNPPYVDEIERATLPPEYHHEPAAALFAEAEGLQLVLRILRQALRYLKPEGILIVEVGNSAKTLAEQWPQLPFTWLEFERGGQGVFLLSAADLRQHQALLENSHVW